MKRNERDAEDRITAVNGTRGSLEELYETLLEAKEHVGIA